MGLSASAVTHARVSSAAHGHCEHTLMETAIGTKGIPSLDGRMPVGGITCCRGTIARWTLPVYTIQRAVCTRTCVRLWHAGDSNRVRFDACGHVMAAQRVHKSQDRQRNTQAPARIVSSLPLQVSCMFMLNVAHDPMMLFVAVRRHISCLASSFICIICVASQSIAPITLPTLFPLLPPVQLLPLPLPLPRLPRSSQSRPSLRQAAYHTDTSDPPGPPGPTAPRVTRYHVEPRDVWPRWTCCL